MDLLWFLVVGALVVVPLFKLLPHYGLNPWWAVVAIIPIGLIVILWIMASRVDENG